MPSRRAIVSINSIIDYELPAASPPTNIFSKLFYRYYLGRVWHAVKTKIIVFIRLKNFVKKTKLKPIKKREVEAICLGLYQKFNQDRAEGNFNSMQSYACEALISITQKELQKRQIAATHKYQWSCVNLKAKRLSIRLINQPEPTKVDFVQVAYRFQSLQKIDVFHSKTNERIGGAPEAPVDEVYGFEKNLVNDDTPWVMLPKVGTHDPTKTE